MNREEVYVSSSSGNSCSRSVKERSKGSKLVSQRVSQRGLLGLEARSCVERGRDSGGKILQTDAAGCTVYSTLNTALHTEHSIAH